jgi:hypothetical protein
MSLRTCGPLRPARFVKALPVAATVCLLLWSLPYPARSGQSYLTATFNDKTIDAPIGTGGPANGEPSWVDAEIEVIVRAAPFDTPSLEIRNLTDAGNMGFELDNPVTGGIVAIITDLWLYKDNPCTTWLDLYNSDWNQLAKVMFSSDNSFSIYDADGVVVSGVPCATGRPLSILMIFDFDADTYSIWIDEVQQVNQRFLNITDPNFRRIIFFAGWDCGEGNRFSIDQLRIIDHAPQVPVEIPTWGRLRALFR